MKKSFLIGICLFSFMMTFTFERCGAGDLHVVNVDSFLGPLRQVKSTSRKTTFLSRQDLDKLLFVGSKTFSVDQVEEGLHRKST